MILDAKRQAAVAAARETLGWPFHHAGRGPGGIDCVGVVMWMADSVGWKHDGFVGYHFGIHGDAVLGLFRDRLIEIEIEDALPADVLCVEVKRQPAHAMIVTESGSVIHVSRIGWRSPLPVRASWSTSRGSEDRSMPLIKSATGVWKNGVTASGKTAACSRAGETKRGVVPEGPTPPV